MANNNTANIIKFNPIPDMLIKLSMCKGEFINKVVDEFLGCFVTTPDVDYSGNNISTWNTFENNVILNIKDVLGKYCSEEFLNNTNWKEDFIKQLYPSYPTKNRNISETTANTNPIKSLLTSEIFRDEYFYIYEIPVKIGSNYSIGANIIQQDGGSKYKSNFGNIIGSGNNNIIDPGVYMNNVYGSYYVPYNDYFYDYKEKRLGVTLSGGVYKVNTNIQLAYKCVVNIPVIVNNTVYYVSGVGTKYIECVHNTADDIIIYIPKEIDNSDNVNNNNLPELAYIEQDGVYMKSNGWAIHTRYCNSSDYAGTPYAALMGKFNIYVIKGQKSYDSVSAGTARKIKIKIETK